MRSKCQSFPTTSYGFSPEEHYAAGPWLDNELPEGPRGQALDHLWAGPLV